MKEGDHIGFAMLCVILFAIPMLALIHGNMLVFFVSSICLGLAIPFYYLVSQSAARGSWYWEEVRQELEGKDLRDMWCTHERGDWLLWFAAHMIGKQGWPTHQQVVLASCQCARQALKYIRPGEVRPLKAIETAEAWARGEATLEQVRNAGGTANYSDHDSTAYSAAQAAYSATWAIYAREDGCCFRLAQAASAAASRAATAAGYERFTAQLQKSDFSAAADGSRNHAEKTTLRESAEIVRRMLSVPDELTNELPMYDLVKRWDRNSYGKCTGRMRYIPVAVPNTNLNYDLTGKEIDNSNINPALRKVSVFVAFMATCALIGALNEHPIQYYTILRWLTCSAAVILICRGYIQGSLKWAYLLVPVAILFNPIIPIHLHGKRYNVLKTWQTIDVVAAVVMVLTVTFMEIQVWLSKKRRLSHFTK